jgi:hypothetical protein
MPDGSHATRDDVVWHGAFLLASLDFFDIRFVGPVVYQEEFGIVCIGRCHIDDVPRRQAEGTDSAAVDHVSNDSRRSQGSRHHFSFFSTVTDANLHGVSGFHWGSRTGFCS